MHTLFNPSPFKHPNPIPTLRHLFRSIPIQMPHLHPAALFFKSIPAQIPDPHPAALFFKCDNVQMPQSAPCGTLFQMRPCSNAPVGTVRLSFKSIPAQIPHPDQNARNAIERCVLSAPQKHRTKERVS